MTEYGRSTGSQPWHPEDPLYGDLEWEGRQAPDGGAPYDGRSQQEPYPHHPQQQWDTQGGRYGDPSGPYPGQPHPPPQQYGWDPSQTGGPAYGGDPGYGGAPYDPQGGPYGVPPDPYATPDAYPPPQPEHTPHPEQDGYDRHAPPPERHPPRSGHHPQDAPGQPAAPETDAERTAEWQPEPDAAEHPFFADQPDRRDRARTGGRTREEYPDGADHPGDAGHPDHADPDHPDEEEAGPPPERGGKRTKRRNGMACLLVTVILGGAVGGGGYVAYRFWQDRFAPAPDYAGDGSGEVQVEIPDGTGLAAMGDILQREGVVRSSGAFVEAAGAESIRAGVYTLKKKMSGEAAVELMTDPANLNTLTIPEGWRTTQVYAAVDKKLGLASGTTEKTARNADLGLPEWADGPGVTDPVEGFLFPAQYGVKKGMKPEDLLKRMVQRAEKEYTRAGLEKSAADLGLDSPRQALTVASLVQAEGKTKKDFEKVARVVYNRLKPGNTETNGFLDFDSTYNYAKNQSTLDVPPVSALRKFDHPYNTYNRKGLPPGPIGNPGAQALQASVDPAEGGWFYFVSLSSDNTVFSETYEEHQRNVEKYNRGESE